MSALLATVLLATLAADRPSAGREVRGRVLSEGKAVPGARVVALPVESPWEAARREARGGKPAESLGVATTGPDGTFAVKVTAPAATEVEIEASAAGFVPARVEDEAGSTQELSLSKAQALSGRVVDPTGGPVMGATVMLWPGRGPDVPLAQIVTTDAKGVFHFDTAAATGNHLRVEAPGLTSMDLNAQRAGNVAAAITLTPGRVVRGTLLLPDGHSRASGALVRFDGASPSRWVETHADGTFVLQGLPAVAGKIAAEAGEAGQARQSLNAADVEVKIVLAQASALVGHVVDSATRKPIVGARVVALAGRDARWSARSGSGGSYDLRGLPAQGYVLTVDAPHYATWSRRGIRLETGKPTTLDVPMAPAASLSGKVVDAAGAPIEGAVGRLVPTGGPGRGGFRGRGNAAAVASADATSFKTAKDGTFKLDRVPPGSNQELVVRHDTHETAIVGGLSLAPGSAHPGVKVVLPPGLTLQGVVHDDQGHPVPGADVDLARNPGFGGGGRRGAPAAAAAGPERRPQVQTGGDGRFLLKGLSAGNWTLTVSKPGFAREVVDPVKVTDNSGSVDVGLKPGAAIRGFVRDRTGEGVAGYRVTVGGGALSRRRGPNPQMDPSGPDGAFSIEGLDDGAAYDVVAIPERGSSLTKRSVAAPADDVELTVADRGTVLGTVTDAEGKPVTEFAVSYVPDGRGGGGRGGAGAGGRGGPNADPTSLHSDDGTFALDDVPPGRWAIEAIASGFQRGRASGVVVEEGGTTKGVAIRLVRGGVVSGRVVESQSGQPILGATVSARLTGATAGRGGGQADAMTQLSDEDGRFEISGLAPGTYALTARHPDWSDGLASVELKDATASADIRLGPGASLTGTVVTGGRPVAGASVALRGGAGPGGGGANGAMSDAAGRFRFDRLAAGRYQVTASLGTQSSTAVDAVLPAADATQDVTVTLGDGATIRGVVSGLSDAQLVGVRVSANGPESYGASVKTSPGGSFELSGAPVGTILLRADAGDMTTGLRSATSRVVVAQGQVDVTAEIAFPPGFRLQGHVTRVGQPVAGAMVTASATGGGGRNAAARTDDGGAYFLDGLPDGTYSVRVAPAEAGTSPVTRSVEVDGDQTFDVDLPGAKVAGTVVDAATQQPLADATVALQGGRRGGMGARTDSSGRFDLEGLGVGGLAHGQMVGPPTRAT